MIIPGADLWEQPLGWRAGTGSLHSLLSLLGPRCWRPQLPCTTRTCPSWSYSPGDSWRAMGTLDPSSAPSSSISLCDCGMATATGLRTAGMGEACLGSHLRPYLGLGRRPSACRQPHGPLIPSWPASPSPSSLDLFLRLGSWAWEPASLSHLNSSPPLPPPGCSLKKRLQRSETLPYRMF